MRRAAVAVALVIGALVAGSVVLASGGHRIGRPSLRTDLRLTRHVPCSAGYHHLVGPKVFSRFHAVTAVLCTEGHRTYPGQGQWEVIVRKVAVSGVPGWQRYFEQPSEPNLPKGGCTLNLIILAVPAFVDGHGHALRPRTPVDRCGHPLAFPRGEKPTRVRWHVVSVHRVKQVITAAAVAANCPMEWGNEVAEGGGEALKPGTPLFRTVPYRVHVCVYRTPVDNWAVGRFVRGSHLSHSQTRRLVAALSHSNANTTCPKQRTFAVISTGSRYGASVELGGCWRVNPRYRHHRTDRADPRVVKAILGAR